MHKHKTKYVRHRFTLCLTLVFANNYIQILIISFAVLDFQSFYVLFDNALF